MPENATLELNVELLPGTTRHDVIKLLTHKKNIGIELGVAEGGYSKHMVASGLFTKFFGVDSYGDNHDTAQYKRALKNVGLESHYSLLRMRFDEAIDLFPDEYFDFIYVDGYAHSGEEGGSTIFNWYKKLKIGGVIAGDDYHDKWPLVKWAVKEFALQTKSTVYVTDVVDADSRYDKYPSWAAIKTMDVKTNGPPAELLKLGQEANHRVLQKRMTWWRKILRNVKSNLKS